MKLFCKHGHPRTRNKFGQCIECQRVISKRYRELNADEVRKRNRDAYALKKAKVAEYNKKNYARNRIRRRANILVNQAKKRAKQKGIPFALTGHVQHYQSVIDKGVCEVTGLPFVLGDWKEGKYRSPFSPSLDRIEPELGYVHGNVRVVLWALNGALGDWGPKVYVEIARAFIANNPEIG